jgi:hypothetical protein
MHHLGAGNDLPPFWSQMPRFFAYPFSVNGAIFLALLAILAILSFKLFSTSSLLILLPVFVIGSLVIRHGLRVIEFCSQGRARPPSIAELFDGNPTTLKMVGLMLAYGAAVVALARFGWLGTGGIVCLSGLLPASIMLLAIHGSLRSALDPIAVVQLAARTGWSYIGLVLLLMVTSQGPQQALRLLPDTTLRYFAQHSPEVLVAILVVSTAYFNMVMGAMMGYLLFQHHQDLGIAPDQAHAAAPSDQRALALARAVILLRESRYEDALRQTAGTLADYPNDLPVLAYHHKLLCAAGSEPDRVAQHTERYLQALADAQRKRGLVAVLEAARRVLPQYRPHSLALRRALAEEYFLERKCKPAIALLAMMHKEAPGSSEVPAAYFLLARIYSEGVRDDGKALMILDFLLQHFAGHAMAGEITHYRSVIAALAQPDQAGACAAA